MEKRYLALFVWVFCGGYILNAQHYKPTYLFDEFQDATVLLKGRGESKEKMNYDLLTNKFLFLDKANEVKEVTNTQDIAVIRMGDRTFCQEKDGGVEIIPIDDDVTLYVLYKVQTRVESPKGAFGGNTETSSVKAYSGVYTDNRLVSFDPRKMNISGHYNIYWLEKGNKKKQFKTFKQFLKIYPKHKVALEDYIKENKIQFQDVSQIKQLCLYVESL